MRRRVQISDLFWMVLLTSVAMGPAAVADVAESDQKDCVTETPGHVLHGHRFLPSYYFPTPFALPLLSFNFGFGWGTFNREFLGIARDLDVGTIAPRIEGQIKITKRLVFIAGMTGNAILGLRNESIGLYGASARYLPRLGLLWEPWRSENSVVSLGIEWEKPYTLQASPAEFVSSKLSGLLGGPEVPSTTTIETTRWRPNIRFAHGFSAAVGIVAFAGVEAVNETFRSVSSSSTLYTVGANLSTDFKPLWKVPLGATLSFRVGGPFNGDEGFNKLYSFGIFETFSRRFNFGLELGRFEQSDQQATLGAFVTRYYY